MRVRGRCPSWNRGRCVSQDETSFIQTSVSVGIVFAVGRRFVDQDELSAFSNETGIQKVKGPNLVDRRIVDANQTKGGVYRESVFAETEEGIEFLAEGACPTGFGVGSNQPEGASQLCGILSERPYQKKNPNRYPERKDESACSGQRACGFFSQESPCLGPCEAAVLLGNRSLYCGVEVSSPFC